jgi:hypothetical protein
MYARFRCAEPGPVAPAAQPGRANPQASSCNSCRDAKGRGKPLPVDTPTGLTNQYAEQWDVRRKAFIKRECMLAAPEEPDTLIEDLYKFLVPLMSLTDPARQPAFPWALVKPRSLCAAHLVCMKKSRSSAK